MVQRSINHSQWPFISQPTRHGKITVVTERKLKDLDPMFVVFILEFLTLEIMGGTSTIMADLYWTTQVTPVIHPWLCTKLKKQCLLVWWSDWMSGWLRRACDGVFLRLRTIPLLVRLAPTPFRKWLPHPKMTTALVKNPSALSWKTFQWNFSFSFPPLTKFFFSETCTFLNVRWHPESAESSFLCTV